MADQHVIYAFENPSGSIISQVRSQGLDPAIEQAIEYGDGAVDPRYLATLSQQPQQRVTTTAIAAALAEAGISGKAGAYSFYWQKTNNQGTRATGANHFKISGVDGFLIPTTLQASQGEIATIEYQYNFMSDDGANAPLSVSTGVSLPGTADVTELFTVGTAVANGTTIDNVIGITVEFGIELDVRSFRGLSFPTFVGIRQRQPTITVRTTDALTIDDFSTNETTSGAGSTTHYGQAKIGSANTAKVGFRKMIEGGVREAGDTDNHVVLTVNEGRLTLNDLSGDGNDPAETEAVITPSDDLTNDIVSVATAASLP